MEESAHLVPVNDHCPKFDYSVTLEGCARLAVVFIKLYKKPTVAGTS